MAVVSFTCAKREKNRVKHGLDLADSCILFAGYVLDMQDDRYGYGEDRRVSIGLIGDVVVACA